MIGDRSIRRDNLYNENVFALLVFSNDLGDYAENISYFVRHIFKMFSGISHADRLALIIDSDYQFSL